MTFNETAVIVVGAFLGYWVIDALLNKKSVNNASSKPVGSHTAEATPVAAHHDNGSRDYEEYIANNWHSILGVHEDADKEKIISAYQQLLAECHPDTIAQMGEEFRELAASKSRKIKDAYDFGMNRLPNNQG